MKLTKEQKQKLMELPWFHDEHHAYLDFECRADSVYTFSGSLHGDYGLEINFIPLDDSTTVFNHYEVHELFDMDFHWFEANYTFWVDVKSNEEVGDWTIERNIVSIKADKFEATLN